MRVPIHDEIVLQVPRGPVVDGIAALESAMTTVLFGVPITSIPIPLIDEAGVSHWMTSECATACAEMRRPRWRPDHLLDQPERLHLTSREKETHMISSDPAIRGRTST